LKDKTVEKILAQLYEKQAQADAQGNKILSKILSWQIKKYEKTMEAKSDA